MGKKTEDTPKTPIDQRFIERINERQKDKNFPGDPELSRVLSKNPNNKDLINKIRKGKQSVQIDNIELFSTSYSEDKGYIYLGVEARIIESGETYRLKEEIKQLEKTLLSLNEQLTFYLKKQLPEGENKEVGT